MTSIHPVVLCGGNGTRLWPLSRKALPKQFAPLIGQKSLLLLTLERLKLLNLEITCVAAEEHRFMVQESMETAGVRGRQLLEPMGCWRRLNSEPPCRFNIEPGLDAVRRTSVCG